MPDPFAKNSMLFPTASLANTETMLVGEERLDRLYDGSWCNNVGGRSKAQWKGATDDRDG